MCGIFGIAAFNEPTERHDILNSITGALQLLEYRGYDSAGVSVDIGDSSVVYKTVGRVSELVSLTEKDSVEVYSPNTDNVSPTLDAHRTEVLDTWSGIAHTRWATHGTPSLENCHPIASDADTGSFTVVHNGVRAQTPQLT